MPLDQYRRYTNYLRISLTDRCNLRCLYCMPITGSRFLSADDFLTPTEIEQIARVAVSIGFRKFRLTGGEPTLRSDLLEIVRRLGTIRGIGDLAMTTNGLLLSKLATPLAEAGLRRVNVHLDTLRPDHLSRIMRWSRLKQVQQGIQAAEEAGLRPIKLNAVVVRGYNDADVVELAALTVERDWQVRFIELMPLGSGECAEVARQHCVSRKEVQEHIEKHLGPLIALPGNPADECVNYRLLNARGVVGFISPVSVPYCKTCNRMRLTADGKFQSCLLNSNAVDVKKTLRESGPDAVPEAFYRALALKPLEHHLSFGVFPRDRRMFQIGG